MVNSDGTFTPDKYPEITVDFTTLGENRPQSFRDPAEYVEVMFGELYINNKRIDSELYEFFIEQFADDWEKQILQEIEELNETPF